MLAYFAMEAGFEVLHLKEVNRLEMDASSIDAGGKGTTNRIGEFYCTILTMEQCNQAGNPANASFGSVGCTIFNFLSLVSTPSHSKSGLE